MVVAKGKEKRMVRTRIEIKKIDNITTRQVTFSKRRRGLFKKAHELSILCDTEIGVIVFSSTSKLHEFSSSSTTQIVQRYIRHKGKTNNEQVASSLLEHLPAEDVCVVLRKDVAERSQEVRKMKGEDLDGLSLEELSQLERQVKKAYARVHRMKDDKLQKLITGLKRKEENLVDCNGKLKQKINNKVKGDEIHWSRTQLELASSEQTQTQNNVSFDTSLRLGLI